MEGLQSSKTTRSNHRQLTGRHPAQADGEGVRGMEEATQKSVKKTLLFKKSGERLSIEIQLENLSASISSESIKLFLDSLYDEAKKAIS